jgi:hypothetical protein
MVKIAILILQIKFECKMKETIIEDEKVIFIIYDSQSETENNDEEKNIIYIIYLIRNLKNNKVFIDSTTNYKKYEGNIIKWSVELEFKEHKKNLNRKTKNNLHPLLYADMKEFGENNFEVKTLEYCNIFNYYQILNSYKKELNSENENYGYNIGYNTIKGIIYLVRNIKNKKYILDKQRLLKK